MRRLLQWMAHRYPAGWRERYAAELDALIDEIEPKWHDVFNVMMGAIQMQIAARNPSKIVALGVLTGLLAAGTCALLTHDRYVSTATVRFTFADDSAIGREREMDRLTQVTQEILSRKSLGELITQPAFDLYQRDRKSKPLEGVVQKFRKDLHITSLGAPTCCAATIEISCTYPDKFKAQSVVREIVSMFQERLNNTRPVDKQEFAAATQLLSPPDLPELPYFPNRPFMLALGLLGGAVLGFSIVLVQRTTARLS